MIRTAVPAALFLLALAILSAAFLAVGEDTVPGALLTGASGTIFLSSAELARRRGLNGLSSLATLGMAVAFFFCARAVLGPITGLRCPLK